MGECVTRRWPWFVAGPLDGEPLHEGAWEELSVMAAPTLEGEMVAYVRTTLGVAGSEVRVGGLVHGASEAERVYALWEKVASAWMVPGRTTTKRLRVEAGVRELLELEQRTVVLSVVDGRLTLEAKDDEPGEPSLRPSTNGSG